MAEELENPFAEIQKTVSDYIHTREFKRFMSALDESMNRKNQTTLSVMSHYQGEGKSFLTCAIAVAFVGFLGKRVLVVDATRDSEEINFLSALIAGFARDTTLPEGTLDIVSGRGLAGGRSGQTDFRLRRAIERFGDSYDRIIIDTVSLQEAQHASIDPIVVARQGGQGLLVTSPLSLHIDSIKEISRELVQNHVPLMGTVYFGGVGG